MDTLKSVLAGIQTHQDAQALFWLPIGNAYWSIVSGASFFGCLLLLRNTIKYVEANNKQIDAIVVQRLLWLGGLALATMNPANSAFQAWCVVHFVAAGVMGAFLLETGWCQRHGTAWQKFGQITREACAEVWHTFDTRSKKASGND